MIKTAVVGVGYLGKFHAEKYRQLASSELIAVVDIDAKRAAEVAKAEGVEFVLDYKVLLGKVDAVSIVVPTKAHYEIAKFFLENGVHVLLEKPVTETVEQAKLLIDIAEKNQLIFQVGHLERFNSAIQAISGRLKDPRFIESHRIAPFNFRGTDVNVVLDLMIHDIDIIQSIVSSPIKHIDANGARVLSKTADIANARITFANDCVANVTARRVSFKSERKLRIFERDAYFSLDLHEKKLNAYRRGEGEMLPGIPNIAHESLNFEKQDALYEEIASFLHAITTHSRPLVSGEDGMHSLQTAIMITELLRSKADY